MSAFPVRGIAMGAEARKPIEETANLIPKRSAAHRQMAVSRVTLSRVARVDEGFALPDAPISRRAGQVARRKWKSAASSAACEDQDRAVRRIRAGK